ncbi:hypothetical protein K458DRAFT_407110 [Lentithecium fluviatile CBS 122367]|uniref:Uncharacterized protein n=1 Tax=Lentithecium fluviatile CBS 122367 TaxID=1168545 RepID=A0A6G1IQU2_9PLEO|nr:hypothetical protein K458DRAFT_407110 [Lentithecium fluviatile CBS 122367]
MQSRDCNERKEKAVRASGRCKHTFLLVPRDAPSFSATLFIPGLNSTRECQQTCTTSPEYGTFCKAQSIWQNLAADKTLVTQLKEDLAALDFYVRAAKSVCDTQAPKANETKASPFLLSKSYQPAELRGAEAAALESTTTAALMADPKDNDNNEDDDNEVNDNIIRAPEERRGERRQPERWRSFTGEVETQIDRLVGEPAEQPPAEDKRNKFPIQRTDKDSVSSGEEIGPNAGNNEDDDDDDDDDDGDDEHGEGSPASYAGRGKQAVR